MIFMRMANDYWASCLVPVPWEDRMRYDLHVMRRDCGRDYGPQAFARRGRGHRPHYSTR
jgi:hypothetical protein